MPERSWLRPASWASSNLAIIRKTSMNGHVSCASYAPSPWPARSHLGPCSLSRGARTMWSLAPTPGPWPPRAATAPSYASWPEQTTACATIREPSPCSSGGWNDSGRDKTVNPEPRPDWFPDEAGLAGHEHFDDAHVAIYDSKSGIDPGEDIDLLKQWGLSEHSVVVDMGAGTGVFARAIAPFCRQVDAVDVSPLMLNQLTAKAQQARLDNISCVSDSFLGYRHPGGSADFVYSRNALHHLPDFWKALALDRVGSMLASGG